MGRSVKRNRTSGGRTATRTSSSRRAAAGRSAASDDQPSASSSSPLRSRTGGSTTASSRPVSSGSLASSGGVRRVPPPASRMRVRGMGVRAKLMVSMAVLTAVGMAALGGLIAAVASNFLFDQTKHQGVELAKMTAQVGRAVLDNPPIDATGAIDRQALEQQIVRYLENARIWGDGGRTHSFIDAIQFKSQGPLGGIGIGNAQTATSLITDQFDKIDIPGGGTVNLVDSPDIEVIELPKNVGNEQIPVYRFKVKLNQPTGPGYENSEVWVDMAIHTVNRVSLMMMVMTGAAVLLVTGAVLLVANVIAGRIARPVKILMQDMRQVAKGDLDHRTRAHSTDEVGVLASEFNLMTKNLKVAQSALIEQEKAEYELSIAREVQRQLLPAEAPQIERFEVAAFYQGAQAVSGDYYDFIPLGDGLWGFIVADVSGKGIPGSMVMAVTRTIVRLVAQRHLRSAADTLKDTNRLIARQIKRGMFVTAFYVVLDQNTGQIVFTSAGHNPMVVYRAAEGQIQLGAAKGIAIGFNEGPLFDKNIQQLESGLNPGDCFVLYTDGFPEAMDGANEEFGEERFYASIARHAAGGAQPLIDGLIADIEEHRGSAAQSDDLTMIVVRRVA